MVGKVEQIIGAIPLLRLRCARPPKGAVPVAPRLLHRLVPPVRTRSISILNSTLQRSILR